MRYIQRIFSFVSEFIRVFNKDNISVYAAQASFFILFSAIPFFMLLLGFAKYFIPFSKPEILNTMLHFLPQDIYYFASDIINELFSRTPGSLVSVTAVTMMWSASRGVSAIIRGLNAVFNVEDLGFIKMRIVAFFYTFLFIVTLIMTLIVLFLSKSLVEIFSPNIYFPLLFIMLTLIFAASYTYLPKHNMSFKSQLAGAALVSASWIIFTWLYTLYIDNFSNFSYIYGSLAAIVLSMLWLYVCMTIFLCGAQFNQMLYSMKNEV